MRHKANSQWVLGLLLAALSLAMFAQDAAIALNADVDGKKEAMRLDKLAVHVKIIGAIAETRMTMTFFNPHQRQLAGDLYFPLPEGAFVSGYALDINGVLVDGVVVEKEKGRQVFEELSRQRIDPGIVQWSKGNTFNTRVFPLPPQGRRTVMVRYIAELARQAAGTFYLLPLRYPHPIKDFSLRMEVIKNTAQPKLNKGPLGSLTFNKWQESEVAETSQSDIVLDRDLSIEIPALAEQAVWVEKTSSGEYYFLIDATAKAAVADKSGLTVKPTRIGLYWDASGSRLAADRARELELLRTYLNGLRQATVHVDLCVFRDVMEAPVSFAIQAGDCAALIDYLRAVAYDGGTQLGALRPLASKPDLYLLFSDGIANFGQELPAALNAPLYAFSSQATADHAMLHYIADSSGGQYFNLATRADDAVVPLIGQTPNAFVAATALTGEIARVCPGQRCPLAGRLLLAGVLQSDEALVRMQYGRGAALTDTQEFRLQKKDAAASDMIQTFWAQKKIAELMIFSRRNTQELTEIGKKYGLVTPGTSLIVLDNLNQYVQYKIAPPKSQPELRRQFEQLIERQQAERKRSDENKIDRVLRLWQERVVWWNTDFSKALLPAKKTQPPVQRSRATVAEHVVAEEARSRADQSETPREGVAGVAASPPMALMAGSPAPAPAMEKKKAAGQSRVAAIAIEAWQPDTAYLHALKNTAPDKAYAVYLQQRAGHSQSPGFYLDCADYFFTIKQKRLGLRILSNIAELELENGQLLRILGHRLEQLGRLDLSAAVFEQVLVMRPEEPQSWRDLALVVSAMGKYERAVELLNHVLMADWDGRFDGIEVIALEELNCVIARAKAAGIKEFKVSPRLIQLLDVDIRIVMTWDADQTDIDLWVFEPTEEKAFYGHNRTTIGGLVSRDFTQGYGPEEYMLRRAMRGKYKIMANYYGSASATLLGPVTVQVDVFTNYGRANEKKQSLTLRLGKTTDSFTVGVIEF